MSAWRRRLRLRLSPDVVIALRMRVKVPGERMQGEETELIATHQAPDAMTPYERLLGDALEGDQSLFAREDAIEAQWRIVQPVLDRPGKVYEYEQNTWGPPQAESIIDDQVPWLNPAAATVQPGLP